MHVSNLQEIYFKKRSGKEIETMLIPYCMKKFLVCCPCAVLVVLLTAVTGLYASDEIKIPLTTTEDNQVVVAITATAPAEAVAVPISLQERASYLSAIIGQFQQVKLKEAVTSLLEKEPADSASLKSLNKAAKHALNKKKQDSVEQFMQQLLTCVQPSLESNHQQKCEALDTKAREQLNRIRNQRKIDRLAIGAANCFLISLFVSSAGLASLSAMYGSCSK